MKYNPFIGLNKLTKEERNSDNSFDMYNMVEELTPSFQEGQTKDMFLFLCFIDILSKVKIDFLVKGGTILHLYLNEHVRRSKDVDVFAKDPDKFFKEVNDALSKDKGDISFKTRWIKKREANENYYHNTFAFYVDAYHDDKLINSFIVDGKCDDCYDKLEKIKYYGPKIIDEDFIFYGVNIEYITSEKILAVTSDQLRPVKHLIDLYSLINVQMDIDKLNKILKQSLIEENKVREAVHIKTLPYEFKIREDKEFLDSYFLEMLSAGYNMEKDDMIDTINQWLKENIK